MGPAVAEVAEAAARVEGESLGVACGNRAVGRAFPRAGLAFGHHQGWGRLGVGKAGMACRGRALELCGWREGGNRSVRGFFVNTAFVGRGKGTGAGRRGLTRNKASGGSVWTSRQTERGWWEAPYF